MKIKKIILIISAVIFLIIIAAGMYMYPSFKFFMFSKEVIVDENLTAIIGGGGNSIILNTDSAIVVIDTKMSKNAEKLYQKVLALAQNKKIIVINTHCHGDHIKGNYLYPNSDIFIGDYELDFLHKNIDTENFPNNIIRDSLKLNLGNEVLKLYNVGQAHTFSDIIIYLENRKILLSGDLISKKVNPVLDKETGADVDKLISVLQYISQKFEIEKIIPGHGEICDENDISELINYYEDFKTAAGNPEKKKEIIKKYKDWVKMPGMATTKLNIEFVEKNNLLNN